MNIKSEIEQIRQTKKTWFLFKPCSITKRFWGPTASIKLNPRKKPKIKVSINEKIQPNEAVNMRREDISTKTTYSPNISPLNPLLKGTTNFVKKKMDA